MTAGEHTTVLLNAAVTALSVQRAGCYVDATFGRGGHSRQILSALSSQGQLHAFDRDPQAKSTVQKYFSQDANFHFYAAAFSTLKAQLEQVGLVGHVDGLLMDLGVSSPQFDQAERGFSFRFAGPLDMRMNPQAGVSLGQWLSQASTQQIANVIYKYGEEKFAKRIAAAIRQALDQDELANTAQLAEVIKSAIPAKVAAGKHIHPATQTFQAFRIYINRELEELELLLDDILEVLAPGGRLVVISFHSLEDRIVKRFIKSQAKPKAPKLPMVEPPRPALLEIGKAQRPSTQEQANNRRARSAIMRVAERTTAPEVTS